MQQSNKHVINVNAEGLFVKRKAVGGDSSDVYQFRTRAAVTSELIHLMMTSQSLMMLLFLIFSGSVKGWNSSSDIVTAPNIIKLQALDMWRLKIEWSVNQMTEDRNQTYEVQVGRTENMDIVDSINISTDSLSDYTMVWTSQMPLQCADHSVRVRRLSGDLLSSSWSSWKTNYGEMDLADSKIKMYPQNQVLKEGCTVFFCCVHSKDVHITSLTFNKTAYNIINLSPQVKAIRVENLNVTDGFGVHFYCEDNIFCDDINILNFVTFPPEKPQDFRCETKDMIKVLCSWKLGRSPDLGGSEARKYELLIGDSAAVNCVNNQRPPTCSFPVISQQTKYNITLRVTNSLGQETESYIFNIRDIVFPVPERFGVNASVFDALVHLQLNGSFKGLPLICQIEVEPGGEIQEVQKNGSALVQHFIFRLQQLQPSTPYSTKGRCAVQGNDWGKWTHLWPFITEPLVKVDLWRRVREDQNRTVTLMWHPVGHVSASYIEAYEVCVSLRDPLTRECRNVTLTQLNLTIGIHVCDITVRAVTRTGLSVPSHLTILPAYTGGVLKEKRIMGNGEVFQLSWSRDSATTCDYTIEWCMLGSVSPCTLKWTKVPANQTSLVLKAEDFKKGVRYTFTIYGCNTAGYRRHEKQIGYLEEQEPTKHPVLDPNPSVTWSSVNLQWSFNEEDSSHTGFITGYEIRVQEVSNEGSILSSSNWSIENPHSKSFAVGDLKEDQTYLFHLAACTSVGCGPETISTFRTKKNYYLLLPKVLIPLLMLVGCCFCLCSFRRTLQEIPDSAFGFLHIKTLELDEDLYKVSEKIRTLRTEECNWSDVEILDVRLTVTEKTWLKSADDPSCLYISPKLTALSPPVISHQHTPDMRLDLTNFTYMPSVLPGVAAEMFETEYTKQEPEISGSTSDYVISVTL